MDTMRLRDIKESPGVDITNYPFDRVSDLIDQECGLDEIGVSTGVYGVNGKLVEGRLTGTIYKITKRTVALFMV